MAAFGNTPGTFGDEERDRLFWWTPPRSWWRRGRENVGDYLSPVIVDRLLGGRQLGILDKTDTATRLLAIGSILHFARDGDTIWGSGINGVIAPSSHRFASLDVRSVRGPLTAQFLHDKGITSPSVYGDPALLLPLLLPELRRAEPPDVEAVYIPHMRDRVPRSWSGLVLHPTTEWNAFLREIQRAAFVMSSSLHGLVIAEAFGIPARWVRGNQPDLKYLDYFGGTGRPAPTAAASVAEAVEMGPDAPPIFSPQALLDAFPWDLWPAPRA